MVHAIPDNVRAAVERDASERDVSLTYVIGTVVATSLGMAWTGAKGYPFRGTTSPGAKWVIQLPVEIKGALQERAKEAGAAMARLIVAMLAEHYGLPIPSPKHRATSQPRDERGRFGQRR
jgi:hypothetical protein